MQTSQYVDRRALGQEVENHLVSDFAWIGAYAFRRDAMIRGEDVDGFADRFSEPFLANRYHLSCEVFKASQAADRLGESFEMQTGFLPPGFARWCDIASQMLDRGCAHKGHDDYP